MKNQIIETIPLIVYENSPNKYLTDIEVKINERIYRFLFNTNATKSQIISNDFTKKLEQIGQKESKGASGTSLMQELVTISNLSYGNTEYQNKTISRSHRSIFGLDLLQNKKLAINLENSRIDILNTVKERDKIRWLKQGHLTIEMLLNNKSTHCLFDTGADSTVIDENYINENPKSFELIGTEEDEDAHGNKIPSNVYLCKNLKVGHLDINDVEMSGFRFGEHMRNAMEGVPLILGNNIIYESTWCFDFKNSLWSSY